MKIDNNILAITNCLFKDKEKWQWVTDEQKELFFFPINRLLSKKYPALAQFINRKSTNKAAALDTWFSFFLDKPYPSWMWSKSQKTKKEKDLEFLSKEYDINPKDIQFLNKINPEAIKEELKYLLKQNENGK
jgi:hypothetical protein